MYVAVPDGIKNAYLRALLFLKHYILSRVGLIRTHFLNFGIAMYVLYVVLVILWYLSFELYLHSLRFQTAWSWMSLSLSGMSLHSFRVL